jgi:hypothetical protein
MLGISIDERSAVSCVTDMRMDFGMGVEGLLQKDGALGVAATGIGQVSTSRYG